MVGLQFYCGMMAPHMLHLAIIKLLIYVCSAHYGIDFTFDCVPIDLTWDRSYHTLSRFEKKMAEVFLFGNVPLVNVYPEVTWFDCDIIGSVRYTLHKL